MQPFPLAFRLAKFFHPGIWLLCIGPALATLAAAPTNSTDFFMRVWQVENGLPQNQVTALVQTRDGYLWVGTYSGLARFDGVRFAVFDEKNTPELRDSRVTSLFEADDGALWIGHENGAVTTCKNGKFQAVDIHSTRSGERVYDISADEASDVWLLSESGFFLRVRDGKILTPPAGSASRLLNLTRASNGALWVARDGRLSRLEHGTSFQFQAGETNTYVQGLCTSHDGGLWVSSNGRLRKLKDGKWTPNLAPPWNMTSLTHLFEAQDESLLAATANDGFFIMFPGTSKPPIHFNHASGFPDDWVVSLLEDREGNIWIGTGGNGLIELHRNDIRNISPPDNWRGRAVLSVYPGQTNDELWVGTEGAGLYHLLNGDWENFGATNGLENSYVWSIARDAAGKLWVGTWGSGLYGRDEGRFSRAPGLEDMMLPVPALWPAREGGLWVGTSLGLLRYQAGQTNWFTGAGGSSLRDVRTIAEATNGIIWFGMAGNGLARLETNQLRQFRRSDGLSSDYVESLHFTEDGALWVGTFDGGLCRLKQGEISVIDQEQGLPNSVISDIQDDGHGNFWMSSHGGIIRASKSELNDCAEGKIKSIHCQTYGINDGLPTIACAGAGCQTADGRIWFPTTKGLVVVNPGQVKINQLPPPMALEELLVDGQIVTNLAPPLKIPPGKNRFEFHYTGLSFVAPEKVCFRYRIEGLEGDWVDAGAKRSANYSFIPPGDYIFHVIACNNNGVWNETGVSLAFTVLPHFWQTWWFHFLGGLTTVLAASAAVWFDMRRRMRRRVEKLEREQAVERERTRIAKDIHDDLGASLTRITMLSLSACRETAVPQNLATYFNRIYGTARELTRAMDEIVWAVNPQHDTVDSLANYLSRFAHDFLNAAGVRCRLDVPLQLPAWPVTAEVRHNLFLAFKEALHNVARHAAATEAQVVIKLAGKNLLVTITDNGRGFAIDHSPATLPLEPDRIMQGNGLANMKRRLAEMSGECEISSMAGNGTAVKFSVPIHV